MSKKWSITPQEVLHANQMAEIVCSELNVKELKIPIDQDTRISYYHDTIQDNTSLMLDVYKNNEPQQKYEFAAWIYLRMMESQK